jgi:hypothetical protein
MYCHASRDVRVGSCSGEASDDATISQTYASNIHAIG